MILSLQDVTKESVAAYEEKPRDKWVLEWPGQVVIAASTIYWTKDVTDAIENGTLKVHGCYRNNECSTKRGWASG